MIEIEVRDEGAREALARIGRPDLLRGALAAAAEFMLGVTRQRFLEARAPDGQPWAPLSPATIERRQRARAGVGLERRGERARVTREVAAATGVRPLIWSGRLSTDWHARSDDREAVVYTPVTYAAVHQFGARRGSLGTYRGRPIPWGDVPARPFLGLSEEEQARLVGVIEAAVVEDEPELARSGG